MAKHHRRIESRFKRPQRSPDGPGTNARERDALLDLKLSPDNQEPFKPVTAEPVEFTLEAARFSPMQEAARFDDAWVHSAKPTADSVV
jgi:hypothetical protein